MRSSDLDCRIWRIYLWICGAAFISCVVGAVALASPSWVEGQNDVYKDIHVGILLFCYGITNSSGRICGPLLFGGYEIWFEAVRVMSLLSWVFLFTVFVMSILLHFVDDRFIFFLPLSMLGFLAGVLGAVAAIIAAIYWTTKDVLEDYNINISWGYIVYVIWHLISLFMLILVCVAGKDVWIRHYTAQQRH